MNRDRDYITEVEMGEDIAGFFITFNSEHWMSNLRYYAQEAGWDSTVGCKHERGAYNDQARLAHAERGIEIPATFFCFDCGGVEEVEGRIHPPPPEQNYRLKTDRDLVVVSGDRSFVANLDPNRPDYVTPDGVEVWAERKVQKVRYLDAFGNQVGPTHKNLVQAVVWATLNGWRDPFAPDWWNDEVYEQTKASATGALGAWEGGWVDRPEAWVK